MLCGGLHSAGQHSRREDRAPTALACAFAVLQRLGRLRRLMLGNLRPSALVQSLFNARQQLISRAIEEAFPAQLRAAASKTSLGAVSALSLRAAADWETAGSGSLYKYLGLHLRNEDDWWEYCQQEAKNPDATWVDSKEQCYQRTAVVARFLAKLQLPSHYPVLYVASGNFTERDALELLDVGFQGVVSERLACRLDSMSQPSCQPLQSNITDRELRAAVDLQMLVAADFFVGNAYSSFSGTVRLTKLARRDLVASLSDSLYYNMPLNTTAADVAPLETHRFGLYPGVFHRELYEAQALEFAHLLAMQREGKCLHKWSPDQQQCFSQSRPPVVAGIQLVHAGRIDIDNAVDLGGWVNTSEPNWYPQLEVLLDGQPAGTLLANARGRTTPLLSNYFAGQVLFSVPLGRRGMTSNLTVCSVDEGSGRVCSQSMHVDLRSKLAIRPEPGRAPVLYIFFPDSKLVTGGPEALHQLHREINRWHASGEIAVRSVFPKGNPFYRGRWVGCAVLHHCLWWLGMWPYLRQVRVCMCVCPAPLSLCLQKSPVHARHAQLASHASPRGLAPPPTAAAGTPTSLRTAWIPQTFHQGITSWCQRSRRPWTAGGPTFSLRRGQSPWSTSWGSTTTACWTPPPRARTSRSASPTTLPTSTDAARRVC